MCVALSVSTIRPVPTVLAFVVNCERCSKEGIASTQSKGLERDAKEFEEPSIATYLSAKTKISSKAECIQTESGDWQPFLDTSMDIGVTVHVRVIHTYSINYTYIHI